MNRRLRALLVTVAWSTICALPPLLVLLTFGSRAEFWRWRGGAETYLVFMWITAMIGTSSVYRRVLAVVPSVRALPPAERRLEHLSPESAGWVRDAEGILTHFDALGWERSLQRAWELANEVDQASPVARAELEGVGASLRAVRELVSTRAESTVSDAELQTRLRAALAEFVRSLDAPRPQAFR